MNERALHFNICGSDVRVLESKAQSCRLQPAAGRSGRCDELGRQGPIRTAKCGPPVLGCDFKIRTLSPSPAAQQTRQHGSGRSHGSPRGLTVGPMTRCNGDRLGYPRKSDTDGKLPICICCLQHERRSDMSETETNINPEFKAQGGV